QIDGSHAFAVPTRRAGDRHHTQVSLLMRLFHDVPQGAILLRLERRRMEQAHTMGIDMIQYLWWVHRRREGCPEPGFRRRRLGLSRLQSWLRLVLVYSP